MKQLIALVALFPTVALSEPNWVQVGTATNSVVYLDYSRPFGDANERKAWAKITYKPPQSFAQIGMVAYVVELVYYLCKEKLSAQALTSYYKANNETVQVGSTSHPDLFRYQETVPGSIDEGLLDIVCSATAPPAIPVPPKP